MRYRRRVPDVIAVQLPHDPADRVEQAVFDGTLSLHGFTAKRRGRDVWESWTITNTTPHPRSILKPDPPKVVLKRGD